MSFDLDALMLKKRKEFEVGQVRFRAKAEKFMLMHTRIKTLGLSCEVPAISEYNIGGGMCLTIEREELPLIREVFGKLEIGGKDVKSGADGTIYVHVHLKELPGCGVQFRYVKTLSAEQKCKIKTVHSSYETLVCEPGS